MTRLGVTHILVAYAALGSVYLFYLPHALPVLDDWTFLQFFSEARAGGLSGVLHFLQSLAQNHFTGHFRLNWAGYLPVFFLYFPAGLSAWPYALLAWAMHILTAFFLCRLVGALASREEAGLLAGAVYAVIPSCNNIRFLFISSSYYYFQSLALAAWLYHLSRPDRGPRWRDLALLPLIVYTGEQIQPALMFLPLVIRLLFRRGPTVRFWLAHTAALVLLLGFYFLAVNRYPITRGLDRQTPWDLRPVSFHLFGSLGLQPAFARWRPSWDPSLPLVALVLLAAAAFFLAWRRSDPARRGPDRTGELLLFSVAGVILTYLPVAWLSSFEWRYLYVPSLFLVPAGVAILELFPRPARAALAACAVLYSVSYTWFEMRQCWIPQSRLARAQLDAIAAHRPYRPEDIVLLVGSPLNRGTAPDFITGASWSVRSALALIGRTGRPLLAGRDLVAGERGELAVFQGDGYVLLHSDDLRRLRVFARDARGRFVPAPVPVPHRVPSHEIALRLRAGP